MVWAVDLITWDAVRSFACALFWMAHRRDYPLQPLFMYSNPNISFCNLKRFSL